MHLFCHGCKSTSNICFIFVPGDVVSECANSLAGNNLADFVMNVGDGSCNTFLNTRLCLFDGGDCSV